MASPEIQAYTAKEQPKIAQGRSFQNTLDFLAEVRTPIWFRFPWPPQGKNQTAADWQRNHAIAGRYLGTDATHQEIANDENLTRQRIQQIVKSVVTGLHANSSQEFRKRYPLESFDFKKPLALAARLRISQSRSGIVSEVANLLLREQSLSQIKKELGSQRVSTALKTLENWGIDIPRNTMLRRRFARLADPDLLESQVKQIFDTVNRSAYHYLSRGPNPLLKPIKDIAEGVGLFYGSAHTRLIAKVLRKAGIAVGFAKHKTYIRKSKGQVSSGYHFIRALDADRAKSALEKSSEIAHLKTNPVTVLGKWADEIPTVHKLQNSGQFMSVMNLVIDIRGKKIGPKGKLADLIFQDCPVPIFVYYRQRTRGGKPYGDFRFRLDQKEELKTYLEKRLRELGL